MRPGRARDNGGSRSLNWPLTGSLNAGGSLRVRHGGRASWQKDLDMFTAGKLQRAPPWGPLVPKGFANSEGEGPGVRLKAPGCRGG